MVSSTSKAIKNLRAAKITQIHINNSSYVEQYFIKSYELIDKIKSP